MRRVLLAAAALGGAVAVAVGVAGCNLLLDASDYAVGPGDGSVTGNPGQDGSSSTSPDAGGHDAVADGAQGSPDGGVIGDPCVTSADCAEGGCGPNGWCTKACTANAACGTNGGGGANYCAPTGVGAAGTCSPGCASDDDCVVYPSAVCAPLAGGSSLSVCSPLASVGDDGGNGDDGNGGTGGTGLAGDPCFVDSDCASNQCFDSSWCTQSCASAADTSCGLSTIGAQNYCEEGGADGGFQCYTSCGTSADCSELTGTVCESEGSQGICNITTGAIGDPCATGPDSTYTACAPAADGGVGGTCGDYAWCSKSCTANSQCGSNTTGQPNYCLQMGGVGGSVCVPSCTQSNDCVPYGDMFCLPVGGSATEHACGTSGGQIGDPCLYDEDCIAGNCGDQYTCTVPCAGADDTSCGINSQNTTNVCDYSNDAQEYECFAGCSTDADCTQFPYDTSTCTLLSGSYVCAYADSTQLRVKKQQERHARSRP